MESKSTNNATPKSNTWWLSLRFSLKTFFVFVAVVSLVLGFWFSRARQQRQAVEVLRSKYSARVMYDYSGNESSKGFKTTAIPHWLVNLLGEDAFFTVVMVDISSREFSDSDMVYLSRFSKLKLLRLFGCNVVEEGFLAAKDLETLEELHLLNVPATDEAVEHLKTMTQLRYLLLQDTEISEEAVQELTKHLPQCRISYP